MRSGLAQHFAAAFVTVFVIVPIAWMALDRAPPHERTNGMISPAAPGECGLPDDAPSGAVLPGSCVKVEWNIHKVRSCLPSAEFNVKRRLRSKVNNGAIWPLPESHSSTIHEGRGLERFFALPALFPYGPAVYSAEACFTCNPLHSVLHMPVCVSKPDIDFEIAKP